MMLKAAIGTMLEAMLSTKLEEATFGMMLGKANIETRRETTAKMRSRGCLILVATQDLQNLPAWLMLEKPRFLCDPCHLTRDLASNNFRQTHAPTTDNRGAVQMATPQQPTDPTSNGTHRRETICCSSMVQGGPNFFFLLPICSPCAGRFYDEADMTHQILRAHGHHCGTRTTTT
jgi:hypothetical protein